MIRGVFRAAAAVFAGVVFAAPATADGAPTSQEFYEWIQQFTSGDLAADVNRDGQLDFNDLIAFLESFNGGATNSGGGSSSGGGGGGDDGGGGGGGGGDDFEPNTDEEGWTVLEPSAQTRKIYVSAAGDNRNNGRSPQQAVRTVAKGISLLRDGKPDWLLLRSGDTFYESLGGWSLSGKSHAEPMVVTSYGTGTRPRLITGNDEAIQMTNNRSDRHHLAFVGLHFEPTARGEVKGFVFVSDRINDVLIEDCYIANYRVNVVLDVGSDGRMENIRLRRNVIIDAHGDSHSQGIFASQVDGLLIEENVIDRNGWDYRAGRNSATIFAHNVYVQRTVTGLTVRGNVIMRASSHGVQARPGGIVEENAFVRNPVSVLFANDGLGDYARPSDRVHDNLIVGGVDMNGSQRRSWGIHLQDIEQVRVTNNVIANSRTSQADTGWGISITGEPDDFVDRTLISGNIVDDYGHGILFNNRLARDVTVRNNEFFRSRGESSLVDIRPTPSLPGVRFENNWYRHTADSDPFRTGADELNIGQWRNRYESSALGTNVMYVDQSRSLDRYAQSIGLPDASSFYAAVRGQRKGRWDDRFTSDALRAYFRDGYALR